MFDRDRSMVDGKSSNGMAASKVPGGGPPGTPSSSSVNRPIMSSLTGATGGLSRTLSTPPIAESTQIGSSSVAWNGIRPGGQSKRRPTSPLLNNRSLFKSSGNLSYIGRVNSHVFADARSPGLVNRLVRYYDREQSAMNRSQSLSSVYNKPGQFPLVQLRKQELRYGANTSARRKGNFSAIRIAPPEKSLFQPNNRSSIFRTGSLFFSDTASETANESIFGSRGVGASTSRTGGDESDAENRVITPCVELEATPTRSVLDALKEISRKRINSEELDADRIKKQCKELSELDAAGTGPPSSTAAVAIGTLGLATKRSREQTSGSSSSSTSEGGSAFGQDRGGGTAGYGADQQILKKRFCSKNNDILSSLSSSAIVINTPKRVAIPRPERGINQSATSMMCSMPSSSSTVLGPTTPEKFSTIALDSPSPERNDGASYGSKTGAFAAPVVASKLNRWNQLTGAEQYRPVREQQQQQQKPSREQPKITLFNRPYDATVKHTAPVMSDGEEDEHGDGSGKVQFVKPKDKSPQLTCGAGSSSRDPLKKPAPSKLSVMLKCLSGDLDDYFEEEEEEDQPPRSAQSTFASKDYPTQTGLGLTFNSTAKDAVDSALKEVTASATAKQTSATTMIPTKPAETPASGAASPPLAVVTSSGISALINSPIKDVGLGKISSTDVPKKGITTDNGAKQASEGEKRIEPPADSTKPNDASKPSTFNFEASAPRATSHPATAAVATPLIGFTSPTAPTTTTSFTAGTGAGAQTPALSFGTPTPAEQDKSQKPKAPLATPNLISFSPAPAAATGGFGATLGSSTAGKSSPLIQFGSVTSTTTPPSTQSVTPGSTFTFADATAASALASTSTTSTKTAVTANVTSPTFTFGGGSTFSAFKSPLPVASTTPANSVTSKSSSTNAGMFAMPAPVVSSAGIAPPSTTASVPSFTFGAKPTNATTAAPVTVNAASSAASTPATGTPWGSSLRSHASSVISSPSTGAGKTGVTFTFGSTAAAPPSTTTAAPTALGTFTFGTVSTTTPASSASSTFPLFGSIGGAANATSAATAATSAAPAQPFMFGGPKTQATAVSSSVATAVSSATPNLFATVVASPNSSASAIPFGGATAGTNSTVAPAPGSNPFGVGTGTAGAATSIFGARTAAANANPGAATGAASTTPFTFGTKSNATSSTGPQNGPGNPSGPSGGAAFFGGASSIASPETTATKVTPSSTAGLFTFGAAANTAAANPTAPKVPPAFGFTSTSNSGSTSNATPFTFGAAASKPAQSASGGAGQLSGGIFGSIATNNNSGVTFGSAMNGGNPLQSATQPPAPGSFGAGPIFGSPASASQAAAAGASATGGSIFGSNVQTNGQQNATNAAVQPSSTGGLFTFGTGTNSSSTIPGSTFGSNAGPTGTFGSLANSGGTAGLTNGIGDGSNKPFTFGASSVTAPRHQQQQQQQQQQQASAPAPISGGFNFSLGSNVGNTNAKPFAFAGNASSTGNNDANAPPMFGAPATNQASAPFTFGASAANSNSNSTNNSGSSSAPFTFGAGATSAQQQRGTTVPGAASPFNFSAGNVASVAPQPQQQQPQQPSAFNFGAAQSPFGAPAVGGAPSPAFGSAPAFGAAMPTFSIGTNSTPNGPPAGQRRIKFATRRVK